jgi:lipopolysaccharide export system permease protein
MIKLISRHIGSVVIIATLLVVLILLGLQVFIALVRELDDLGVGNYGLVQVIQYVLLTLPGGLYQFFPMAGLGGSLFGLGYLASHHELVVMRVSGVSFKQIIGSISKAAIILIVLVTLIGELISPMATHFAKFQRAIAKSGGQALNTSYGVWMRDEQTFIHVQTMVPGVHLLGVMQYQFTKDHRLIKMSYAKKAVVRNDQWWLQDVVETYFDQDSTRTKTIPEQLWTIEVNPELLNASKMEPDQMSLLTLKRLIDYRHQNGLQTSIYVLSFWQRLMQPVTSLIMIFLAVPFILGPLRTVQMGLRVLVGILIGFSFYLLHRFFGSLCLVYDISPIVGAVLPSGVFLTLGFLAKRYVR